MRALVGMLCWKEKGPVRLERLDVAGMKALCAWVPRGSRGEKRLVRAAKLLHRAGVRRILENREAQPELLGLTVVSALPLYRAVADRLVLMALHCRGIAPERACVVLRGEYPDSDLETAARILCPKVRQVVVDTERGGDALQRSLLRQFGAAVTPVKEREDILAIRFSGVGRDEPLSLCDQVGLDGLTVDVPQLVLPEMLVRPSALCALWQAGLLSLDQVRVSGEGRRNKFT